MDDRFDQKLRERLKRLDSAIPPERPAIRLRVGRQLPRARRTSAPILGLAVVALVIAVILSAGLAAQRFVATESSASPGSPTPGATPAATTSQTIVIGPGGFPVSIDGEKVYRFEDQWPDTSASFLVAAGAPYGPPTCPIPFPRPTPGPAADSDFVAECPPVILFDTAGFLSGQSSGRAVAPKGLSLSAFTPWGGHLIVVRAHTHDAEAAQCSPSLRSRCEAALVVEAIVWPTAATPTPWQVSPVMPISPAVTTPPAWTPGPF